jgi:hypothetical protein
LPEGKFQTDRAIFENEIWKHSLKFRLFFFIYGNAVFTEAGIDKGDIHIGRGQFLRSYRTLQEDLELIENHAVKRFSLSQIKAAADELVVEERLKIFTTSLGTLFTVVNYEEYQGFECFKDSSIERRKNAERTPKERRSNNNNKDKKDKNELISNALDIFSPDTTLKITEWITYKSERHEQYKPTGLQSLLTQIQKQITIHGEQKVIDLISECMAAGYKGIIWDKLTQPARAAPEIPRRNNFLQRHYDDEFFKKLDNSGIVGKRNE